MVNGKWIQNRIPHPSVSTRAVSRGQLDQPAKATTTCASDLYAQQSRKDHNIAQHSSSYAQRTFETSCDRTMSRDIGKGPAILTPSCTVHFNVQISAGPSKMMRRDDLRRLDRTPSKYRRGSGLGISASSVDKVSYNRYLRSVASEKSRKYLPGRQNPPLYALLIRLLTANSARSSIVPHRRVSTVTQAVRLRSQCRPSVARQLRAGLEQG